MQRELSTLQSFIESQKGDLFIHGRPASRTIDETTDEVTYDFSGINNQYNVGLWITTITIPTVGYGNIN